MIFDLLSGQLNIVTFITWLLALAVAVTIHEFAHAFASWKLGDPTAKLAGRLTLNPKAHFDTLGTLFLLFTGFGWGKPVPFNPLNFSEPLKDAALVSLAGPASNLLLALSLSLLGHLHHNTLIFLLPIILLNLNLGVFNLLPIAPLDGFQIVSGALPQKLSFEWEKLRGYGFFFLLLLLLPLGGSSLLEMVLSPVLNFLVSLLLPS